MEKIETRYKDMKTGKGHEIRVDLRKNELILWYLYWGEYQGVDDHHHMGIARISKDGDTFVVGWLQGTDQKSHSTDRYTDRKKMFSALDEKIANN